MTSYATIEVGLDQAEIALQLADNLMAEALDDSIDDLLTFIDNAQAKAYTSDANPARPLLSRYRRTFNLQDTTEKVHVLKMQGEWIAKAEYASEVLGYEAQQADIHRGRWKPIEIVTKETIEAAPQIIQENVERRF